MQDTMCQQQYRSVAGRRRKVNEQVAATDTNQDHAEWLRRRAQGRYTATPALARFALELLESASDKSMLVLNALTSGMGDALVARSAIWGMPQPTVMVDPDPDQRSEFEEWPDSFVGGSAMAPEEYAAGLVSGKSLPGKEARGYRESGFDLVFCNACQKERSAQETAHWAETLSGALSPLTYNATTWKQLLACRTAVTCLERDGKAAVLVPASCLGGEALAPARASLVASKLVERVVLLGSGALEGTPSLVPETALIVLSFHNDALTINDVRDIDVCDLDARALIEGRAGVLRVVAVDELLDFNRGLVPLDAGVFKKDVAHDHGVALDELGVQVLIGTNVEPVKIARAEDRGTVCIIERADVANGCVLSDPVELSDADAARAAYLVEGDIVFPRVSRNPEPVLVENLEGVSGGMPVVFPKSFAVVRCARANIDPAYLAAVLSSKGMLDSLVVGGRTKHVGMKELRKLVVPVVSEQMQLEYAKQYRRRSEKLRAAKNALDAARVELDALYNQIAEFQK